MKLFRRRSVRARLTALVVLASTLSVAALFAVLLANEGRQSTKRLDRSLERRIDAIELSLRKNGRLPYREPYGQVIDADYAIVGMSQAVELPGLLSQSQVDFVFRNGGLQFQREDPALDGVGRFLAQVRVAKNVPVVIVVGESESVLHDSRRQLTLALGIGGPILVLLSGLGGWALAGAILKPVRRMTDDASAISQFESSSRLKVGDGRDELNHLGTSLNLMLDRLEGSYQRQRRLVDDTSHELRTPLAIVRGELELALLDPATTPSVTAALHRSLDEVDRLISLTNDLLFAARAKDGATLQRREDTCAPDDIVAAEVQRRARSSTLDWEWSREAAGALIPMRADYFERVLRNICDNAERFASSAVRCTTSRFSNDDGEWQSIVVADDGPGFPEGFATRAFERFAVGEASRTRAGGGIGLGLAIVAELVEAAGGRVEASNATGGTGSTGAVVALTLPIAAPDNGGPDAPVE
jgi:two-component system, OmpR family, sensor kinase